MGTVKPHHSLRMALLGYLPVCLAAMLIGIQMITWSTARLYEQYIMMHPVVGLSIVENQVIWNTIGSRVPEILLRHANFVLIPVWVILCIAVTGFIFYSRELREPIELLTDAAEKIAANELDFRLRYRKNNELGKLCNAFEDMRSKLFDSNMELWHTMEERKRLSAAFSHDLRTPLTVLSGYVELMQKYEGRLDPQKQTEILHKMENQIGRLRNYTEQMNAVQKLEDIVPKPQETTCSALCSQLEETGRLLCGDRTFIIVCSPAPDIPIRIDTELVMQVYENLTANALRYARSKVTVSVDLTGDCLAVTVADDGDGFSAEALKMAARPFYREDKNADIHFGLGLYICRLLCMKHGGGLHLANGKNGGAAVTAEFFCKS